MSASLVCFMARMVDEVDIASFDELLVAVNAGATPIEVSFAGTAKPEAELRQAVVAGAKRDMPEASLVIELGR